MNSFATIGNPQFSDKKIVTSYVHDAAELECAIYTLEKLEEQLQQNINDDRAVDKQIHKWRESDHQEALTSLKEQKQKLEEARRELEKETYKLQNPPTLDKAKIILRSALISLCVILPASFFGTMFILTIASKEAATQFFNITEFDFSGFNNPILFLPLILPLIITLLFFCFFSVNSIKDEKNKIFNSLQSGYTSAQDAFEKQQKKVKDAELECKKTDAARQEAKQLSAKTELNIAELNNQISAIHSRRKELQRMRTEFYRIGIIPPDYRYMDCVMMLDRFFKNNLVNNMQEAVRYYDHKLEIGEIVGGLDNIRKAICDLNSTMRSVNSTMQSVAQRLKQIDDNTYSMHQDILDALDRQTAENKKASNALLEESRAGRYATEQLNETNEKILWYQKHMNYQNN